MASPCRRLASESWRHGISIVVMVAVTIPFLIAGAGGDRGERAVWQAAATLFAFAIYGPAYAVLTQVGFRGLAGEELRSGLVGSVPAASGWRRWLLAGPRSWAVAISLMALVAVFWLGIYSRSPGQPLLTIAGISCALGTWVLLLAIFASEYGRAWAGGAGLQFPDPDDARSFDDFWYVAVQASTTFATSDVAVVNRSTRQTVSIHALTAWLFTTVIIALIVSLAMPS